MTSSEDARGIAVMLPRSRSRVTSTGNPSFVNARRNLRTSVSLNLRGPLLITHLSDQPPRAPGRGLIPLARARCKLGGPSPF